MVLSPRRAGILLSLPALLAIESFSLRLLMCRIRIGVEKKGGADVGSSWTLAQTLCLLSLSLSLFSFVSFFFPVERLLLNHVSEASETISRVSNFTIIQYLE